MDTKKIGALIAGLRKEKQMTQRELAQLLHVSDKTISKWERGIGCPDISLLPELSEALEVDMTKLLSGELNPQEKMGGNMKKTKYTVCPVCHNLILSTGEAEIICCGRRLSPMEAKKAEAGEALKVEVVEDEWYITSDHPMTKEHFITFLAFVTGERLVLMKQYPEWNLQARIPKRGHGMLIWHCTQHGLMYQLL
ncbi:helix-turn-helix domain-containing protein [Hominifimenecus sp. rT4P-3]|uniref:helix-turn-helix domain-containing protein n=1 Tax=Hominifimenecus sp. rT4P-3 TaxID=3242979 RepID=UPI003DA488A3